MLAPENCPLGILETLPVEVSLKCPNLFENLVPGDQKQSDSFLAALCISILL